MPGNRRRHDARLAILIATVLLGALSGLGFTRFARSTVREQPLQLNAQASPLIGALADALGQIQALRSQVDGGHIVPKFGEKAQGIMKDALSKAGGEVPELEQAVDGVLHSLFLQQLSILRLRLATKFESSKGVDALAKADQQFVASANELVRPDSDWSIGTERDALKSVLEGAFRRDAALSEERARAARTQQATIHVISKLQNQMETLQQKVQGMGGGSPWVLSTSYRIPNTPLQITGRYQQGRANIELNLTPDKDPANSEAGFVEGVGPANLGLSFNLGV